MGARSVAISALLVVALLAGCGPSEEDAAEARWEAKVRAECQYVVAETGGTIDDCVESNRSFNCGTGIGECYP